jgi:thiamine biosynthesis lipoprotein
VSPLVEAWGFGAGGEPTTLPDDATLASLRARVGYDKLHVRPDPPSLRKDMPDLSIDLNGIAPGFAVDRLAERLRSMQIDNFMIDIGGEVRTHGRNARGERWRIAVERPIDTTQTPYAIVQLDDLAVSTSGEYRSYYVRDGRRYSHTIDPQTARPVEHDLASVVVIGATAVQADAWGTAFNVLGAEAGLELATKRETPVMFIVSRGEHLESRMTPQFEKYLATAQNASAE